MKMFQPFNLTERRSGEVCEHKPMIDEHGQSDGGLLDQMLHKYRIIAAQGALVGERQ